MSKSTAQECTQQQNKEEIKSLLEQSEARSSKSHHNLDSYMY
jgi:hypothetical protein